MISLPLLWLSLAFLSGLPLGAAFPLAWHAWAVIAACGILFFLFIRLILKKYSKYKKTSFAGFLLTSLALGALRFLCAEPTFTPQDIAYYNGTGSLVIEGTVSSPHDRRDGYMTVFIKTENILSKESLGEWQAVTGKVQIRLPEYFFIRYGDRLLLEGKLQATIKSDQPPYSSWLARKGLFSRMYYPQVLKRQAGNGNPILDAIYRLRNYAHETLIGLLPHPESALLSGILLGIESDIPDYLQAAYRATGTAHIIAISGFNISLIAGLVTRLTNRLLPYGWGALVAICAILFYTLLVGAQPAVVRAAIMGSLAIPAYLIGRKVIGIHSLALTAALMALLNPFILWDVGFQLSFTATFGILTFTNLLTESFENWTSKHLPTFSSKPITQFISEYLLATLAAQFAILPVVITHFQDISLLSLPTNLLILPVQPLVMILGGISLLTGMVFPPMGKLLAAFAWLPTAFTNQVVLFFAMIPSNIKLDADIYFWLALSTLILASIPATYYQLKPHDVKRNS
ncbi:MAG TPA: ComEC family competence protein [Anaerolineae bacterium]|nr:ComEC family competence protein [Anaerolineae bacterium]